LISIQKRSNLNVNEKQYGKNASPSSSSIKSGKKDEQTRKLIKGVNILQPQLTKE
jgi:hypothetical protein